jgi:signal peptidase I
VKQDEDLGQIGAAGAGEKKNAEPFTVRWVLDWVVLIAIAFVLALGIKTFIVQPFVIPSGSMEPTIQIGDRVLVNRFVYRFTQPSRGDIVVFEPWTAGQPDLIKRIVAVGGDTIAMAGDGRFTVNGRRIDEPYLTESNRRTQPGRLLPYKVPRGTVFVMGDNRNNSGDSRFNGPVAVSAIVGKAFVTYWPLARMGGL